MSIDILTTLSVEADACRDMHNTVRAKIYERAAQEIKRLRTVAAAKDDAMTVQAKEIERLRIENSQWQSACAGYTEALAAQDKRVIELMEELARIHDQIAKHNISVREAIRRGEAFEWKTLTLDS